MTRLVVAALICLVGVQLAGCDYSAAEQWEPLDNFKPGDRRATLEEFELRPDDVVYVRYNGSRSIIDYNFVRPGIQDLAEYNDERSALQANLLKQRAQSVGLWSDARFESDQFSDRVDGFVITVNVNVEGEPEEFYSIITIRQGRLFFEKRLNAERAFSSAPAQTIPGDFIFGFNIREAGLFARLFEEHRLEDSRVEPAND